MFTHRLRPEVPNRSHRERSGIPHAGVILAAVPERFALGQSAPMRRSFG